MPLLTITIPVYRVEHYVRRCADSILTQTLSDFELVLVDDGSHDASGTACDDYAVTDERVLVIHQPNSGLSAARNAGIDWAMACSDSKWLAFVDSDDWVHPCYLEYLLRAVEEQRTKLAVCDFADVSAYEPPTEQRYEGKRLAWEDLFINNKVRSVVAWNKLYTKELFNDLRYPVGRIHEDEFLTYKLLHRAGDVALVSASLYSYFQHPDSIMGSRFDLGRLDAVDAFAERVSYFHANGLSSLESRAVTSYFNVCISRTRQLLNATWIPARVRKSERRRIKKQARMILIRYGWGNLSPRANYDYFSFAFPWLMRAIRAPFIAARCLGLRKA